MNSITEKIYCSAASLEFLQSFQSFDDLARTVDDLTSKLAEAGEDPVSEIANTIERCRLCGIFSAMTDNDHVLINNKWHVCCPYCLWNAFQRADLHVDPEMKNTRFVPARPTAIEN